MPTIKELVSDVMAAPIGELIAAVGQGVAEAQQALDRGSLAQILDIYSHADSDDALRAGPLPPEDAASVGAQLAAGRPRLGLGCRRPAASGRPPGPGPRPTEPRWGQPEKNREKI